MSNFSQRTTLAIGKAQSTGATISIVHRTAGTEPAGSGMRETSEHYIYSYTMRDGTTGGTLFKTRHDAVARWEKFITPETPSLAQQIADVAGKQQDDNDHTRTQLTIALAFGQSAHIATLQWIIEQHSKAGEMSNALIELRATIGRDLARHIFETNRNAFDILKPYAVLFRVDAFN